MPFLDQMVHGVGRMPNPRTVEVAVATLRRTEVVLLQGPAQPGPELSRRIEACGEEPTKGLHGFYKTTSEFGGPARCPRFWVISAEGHPDGTVETRHRPQGGFILGCRHLSSMATVPAEGDTR